MNFPRLYPEFHDVFIAVIHRHPYLEAIREAMDRSRIVVLIGPRQCGKTTLARELVPEDSLNYFDLEDPGGMARLNEPMTALAPLRGLVVIDEVQRRPELFPTLRVLADRRGHPARSLGVNESTVRRYLDLLTDAQMLRQLQPYHANVGKRQVKSPKVYVRDSGLFHQLMGLDTEKALLEHPKAGASWEGFAIEQILSTQSHDDAWFWATHQGAEIDLVLSHRGKLFGIEIKRTDTPQVTPSIRNALHDLNLERVAIVHPGAKRYPLSGRVEAVPMASLGRAEGLFPAS